MVEKYRNITEKTNSKILDFTKILTLQDFLKTFPIHHFSETTPSKKTSCLSVAGLDQLQSKCSILVYYISTTVSFLKSSSSKRVPFHCWVVSLKKQPFRKRKTTNQHQPHSTPPQHHHFHPTSTLLGRSLFPLQTAFFMAYKFRVIRTTHPRMILWSSTPLRCFFARRLKVLISRSCNWWWGRHRVGVFCWVCVCVCFFSPRFFQTPNWMIPYLSQVFFPGWCVG